MIVAAYTIAAVLFMVGVYLVATAGATASVAPT
jgi:hypothetical protein